MSIVVPEKDRDCINCARLCDTDSECETCCNGPYGMMYEVNKFIPDEDYIRFEIATCENCKHGIDSNLCDYCSRKKRTDYWEAGGEIFYD